MTYKLRCLQQYYLQRTLIYFFPLFHKICYMEYLSMFFIFISFPAKERANAERIKEGGLKVL